jgi:DNA-binding MarR family transcriptional regulator
MSKQPSHDGAGQIDDVVHQRTRLAILVIAAEGAAVQFQYLRQELDLTYGNLNAHLSVLADSKLVKISKGFDGQKPSTSISITAAGRKALHKEIAALEEIVNRVKQTEAWSDPLPAARSLGRLQRRPSPA